MQTGGEVGMTVERMIELLEIEKECVLRNASGECNRYCAGCDLLQDDTELHEMYTEAIAMLKAQEPRVIIDEELIDRIRKAPIVQIPAADAVPVVRCRDCKYSDVIYDTTSDTMPLKCLNIRYGGVMPDWYCEHGERRDDDADD